MEDGIRVRKIIFDQLMAKNNHNKRNWEMLCCSGRPLVPFIGAGVSAWCYLTWGELLKKVVEDNFSSTCAEIVDRALMCEDLPHLKACPEKFYWMEEIAECIFDSNRDSYDKNKQKFEIDLSGGRSKEDEILQQLRDNIGEESSKKKKAAEKELYDLFNYEHVKEGKKMPEYQNYFQRIFSDILITTNYDKALECCYSSLLSYTYKDLIESSDSWLYRAVNTRLEQMQDKLDGRASRTADVTVPDIPMLLKVHGSMEQMENIALTRTRYEDVYQDEMKKLLKLFFQNSTLIFLGSGLRGDRFLDEMKQVKERSKDCGHEKNVFFHFAFLDELDHQEKQKERSQKLENEYGIYPIFYNKNDLADIFEDDEEREQYYHDYFLGILLENLARRKMYYPQPLELLWDSYRFQRFDLKKYLKHAFRAELEQRDPNYAHREESLQIWKLLSSSEECPLIAITGAMGSGKSTLCESIQELNRNHKDTMQFFYIDLRHCKNWNEFGMRLLQKLNIIQVVVPECTQWRSVAKAVAQRCGGYWRSVLILDQMDALMKAEDFSLWEIVKKMLRYWRDHQVRVIFVCQKYPQDIPCYTWNVGKLKEEESRKVFFSACTSKRYRNISIQEQHVVDELFSRYVFQAASIHLMGRYANSKNDLNSLLEEWELYYEPGQQEERTLAAILWNHLLEEHKCEADTCEKIKRNIYDIWGILGAYPGVFPSVFFEESWEVIGEEKALSEKTLIYMKNAGLCEETVDIRNYTLRNNMVQCVQTYFLKALGTLKPYAVTEEMLKEFAEDLAESEKRYGGLECFRGYFMRGFDGELREKLPVRPPDKSICTETEKTMPDAETESVKTDKTKKEAEYKILDILYFLGEKVLHDTDRKEHKKLNLVLHYEIKTVIRFLMDMLSKSIPKEKQKKAAQTGYLFSHYYHYVPSEAYPLVGRLLQLMEKDEKPPLYQQAKMNRVMGDLLRLTGRKKEANEYYQTSIDLSDRQSLICYEQEKQNPAYRENLRIKAGTLVISSGYDQLYENREKEGSPIQIYKKIDDCWGEAYYHQRMGEMLFVQATKDKKEPKNKKEHRKQRKDFERIRFHFNKSAGKYSQMESVTGTAYILKCMGDLITAYKDIYIENYYCEKMRGKDGGIFYKILKAVGPEKDRQTNRSDWIPDMVACYEQAFLYYYGHIQWRGAANVLQAMGTAYRTASRNRHITAIGNVEQLYGMAEECYRWLGDVQGLADTLDYFGYAYEECEIERCQTKTAEKDEQYKYMALSKWMESREIWKEQGNEEKADRIYKAAGNLRDGSIRPKDQNRRKNGNQRHTMPGGEANARTGIQTEKSTKRKRREALENLKKDRGRAAELGTVSWK